MTASIARAAAAERVASSARPGGEGLPRAARLRSGREIRRVLREGRRLAGPLVELFVAETPPGAAGPRVGVIVPLHGRTVAARNRVRRRLREILRREWLPVARHRGGAPVDVLLRARPTAYDRSYHQLHEAMRERFASLRSPCSGR